MRQVPFRESVAIANMCGFESICHMQRLQDESDQSQSLVKCYHISTSHSSVNYKGWEREKRSSTTGHQGDAGEKAKAKRINQT